MKEGTNKTDLSEIQSKINLILVYLKKDYSSLPILASELVSYFKGDAPSGDAIVLSMVLESKWLLVHELIELSELKRKGFIISSQLLIDHPSEVFSAHLNATYWELSLATQEGDLAWVKKRLLDIEYWLIDPSLSSVQVSICKQLYFKYRLLTSNP